MSGCGGAGTEAVAPPAASAPIAVTTTSAAAPEGATQKGPVTPDRVINPKDVIDVVKGDIKGGEADSGGTPFDHLWQSPDPKLIKDETAAVEVPKGLPPLTPFVPASNPLTKAKIELGRQLYFEPRV